MKLPKLIERIEKADPIRVFGRVSEITGLIIKARGLRVSVGDACRIYRDDGGVSEAEVVGFRGAEALLMAVGPITGIRPGALVLPTGRRLHVRVSEEMVGRILDALGNPIDGKGDFTGEPYPIVSEPLNPLSRQRITEPLDLGIRVLNGLFTCGKGQRLGIVAGTGVGKSVLMGMIARYTEADVNVIALIGERSREVREFIERDLQQEGLKRSVVVICTAQEPALAKVSAAFTATAVAEYFRARGKNVLLMMDSLTRVAMAQREVGLAIGEPPTTKGYTPSVFALLPKLLERAGTGLNEGSITGLYTILVEGDDLTDPVADAAMSVLDGHIVLSRTLAMEGVYPAVDVQRSISRVMPDIITEEHRKAAMNFIEAYSTYRKNEDLINIGAYKEGANSEIDRAIRLMPKLMAYIKQDLNERADMADSIHSLMLLFEEV